MKTLVTNQYGAEAISEYGYGYDALGRRISVTNSGTAFDEPAFNIYGYNSRNELTASNRYLGTSILDTASPVDDEERAYNYDPIGNRIAAQQDYDITGDTPITSTYVTNSLNQYESVMADGSSISLDYDGDGNLIHKDGVQYVFNCENRLVEVSPLAPVIGDTKVAFAYDYKGRRYQKQSFIYASGEWSLVSTATSVWEGWNRIQEKVVLAADSSEEVTSWIWGLDLSQSLQGAGGVGGLLAVVDADAEVDFFLYDANGNVGQLISAADGTLHATYEYDPFGRLLKSTGSKANQNPYRFSTKPFDVETGLYYYGFRYLDVDLGRWVSRDPIGERGGWNLYGFVGNSPQVQVDKYGLSNDFAKYPGDKYKTPYETLNDRVRESMNSTSGVTSGSVPISEELIINALASAVNKMEVNIPWIKVLAWPIPPFGSVELGVGFKGGVKFCCAPKNRIGVLLVGTFSASLTGGFGTMFGDTSVGSKLGKSGKTLHDIETGKFVKNPWLKKNIKSFANIGGAGLKPCETNLSVEMELLANAKAAGGIFFVKDTYHIGSCKVPGGCHWLLKNEVEYELGPNGKFGGRVELEGKGEIKSEIHIHTFGE